MISITDNLLVYVSAEEDLAFIIEKPSLLLYKIELSELYNESYMMTLDAVSTKYYLLDSFDWSSKPIEPSTELYEALMKKGCGAVGLLKEKASESFSEPLES